jgi:ABC-type uncharacterized transport system substrate-binding protein
MRRRDFILLVGGTAVSWPLAARAQQTATSVIGFLHSASRDAYPGHLPAIRQGLSESGLVNDVTIEARWAEGKIDRLPAFADDLIRRQVAVIVAGGGTQSVQAARAATATIPIVFSSGGDPVKEGFVVSLNRPGGNITGVTQLTNLLEPKRLELLREIVPNAALVAVLANPNFSDYANQVTDLQAAARAMGQQMMVLNASSEPDLEIAFATLAQQRATALLVASDPFLGGQREQLVALAARHAVPAIYQWRDFVAIGGLMSYGTSLTDSYRLAGIYAGRIIKGEKPADLPVMQSTKVELAINLKTAKTLGITFPLSLLGRADEVIE